MEPFGIDLPWWISAVEAPTISALFMFVIKSRREAERKVALLEGSITHLRGNIMELVSAFKLEVAKSYASTQSLREVEGRLVAHLNRIEAKLDVESYRARAVTASFDFLKD